MRSRAYLSVEAPSADATAADEAPSAARGGAWAWPVREAAVAGRSGGRSGGRTVGRARATGVVRVIGLVLALPFLVAAPAAPAAAQSSSSPLWLTVEETESLVRRLDYEGMPHAEAERIGPAGAARLREMLADPAERAHHGRILLALGSCGAPDAIEAMRAWVERAPAQGELDRASFRAWQMLPHALGRLAQHDLRAVEELVVRFDAAPPAWTFRQFHAERLQQLERRAAVSALAASGRPEAAHVLDGLARRALDPELAIHVRAARASMVAPTPFERAPGVTP